METIIVISSVITALATLAIAIATYWNYQIVSEMRKESERDQEKFDDLLEALVVATLSSSAKPEVSKYDFEMNYTGKTPILKTQKQNK